MKGLARDQVYTGGEAHDISVLGVFAGCYTVGAQAQLSLRFLAQEASGSFSINAEW